MRETINNLKKVYFYGKEFKINLVFEVLCSLIRVVIAVIIPLIAAKQIVYYTDSAWKQVIYVSIILVLISLLQNINTIFFRKNTQVFRRGTVKNIQLALSKNILKIKQSELDKSPLSLFVERIVNDTDKMSLIFTSGMSNLTSIISSVGCFIAILIINYQVFIYYLCVSAVLIFLYLIRTKKYGIKDNEYRQELENVSELTNELVRGVRDIKMLNIKENFIYNLDKNIDKQIAKNFEMRNVDIMYNFYTDSLINIFEFFLILFLIYLTVHNVIDVSVAIVLFSYKSNVMLNIMEKVSSLLLEFNSFNISCNRVFSVLSFQTEEFGTKHLKNVKGNITFKNVSFSYNKSHKVLENIDFTINAGQTIGIVGKSGVGKSTIYNLLSKLYEPGSGHIYLDEIDINKLDEETIRNNINVISQNPYIFNLSIRDNLKLVKKDLTEKEMISACKMACLDEVIESLPNKYDTILGENGVMLSGGQKQRLAIARAFIQKTKIILFDESTSSLDNETQIKIKKAIDNLKGNHTVVIIAHRLSTIIDCDKIIVLENGKIIDSGSHQELFNRNKTYQKLCRKDLANKKG